ncbi:hypothetical protein [Amycolatopsis sp. NPDC054798]
MPDTISRRDATAREFAELVCADPAWLRAEFEAIMAASFSEAPVLPPPRGEGPRSAERAPATRRTAKTLYRAWPPEHRERSPPEQSRRTRKK